jgi:DNA-binding XRE family transcriptional regulator
MDDRPPRTAPKFPDRILLGDTRHPQSDEQDPRLELLPDDLDWSDMPTATYVRQALAVDEAPCVALGQAVKAARRSRGLTQEEVAQRARLHVSYISLVERGRRNPTVGTLRRIGDVLQVPLSELLREAEAVSN